MRLLSKTLLILFLLSSTVASESTKTLSPPKAPIPDTLFGLHIHRAASGTPWPAVPFNDWRMWDTHTTWRDLEPAKSQWNFSMLDQQVTLAETHHVRILMTLAGTPPWASARPSEKSADKPGAAAEPQNMEDWRTFVRTIATRYRGRIHEYEIWNEPNNIQYWSGKTEILVKMTDDAAKILKDIDPGIVVVSPSATKMWGLKWFSEFLDKGGTAHVDVIGYHFYVGKDAPESIVDLAQQLELVMSKHDIHKPIWCTETGWADPKPFPPDMAPGFVARSYILSWAAGISRFYWYAWDNHDWVTLEMVERDNKTLKPAAVAYGIVEKWLVGATMQSCAPDSSANWICRLSRDGKPSWIIWRAQGQQNFTVPADWRVQHARSLSDDQTDLTATKMINVGPSPLLLN